MGLRNELEEARKRVSSLILDARVNEATRNSQISTLWISLSIAGAIIVALLCVIGFR